MKRLVIISILIIAGMMRGYPQTDTSHGIAFEHGLSWQEVLQKAQKENKYIFVDCYASWCGPCKYMDKKVYPIDSIGAFMNERYISVRVQMDTTAQDNDEIRQWYGTARVIEEKYHVAAYPTYLFFSPDGVVLHKDIGGKEIAEFLSMVRAAMDPQQQYYTLLTDYRSGDMTYTRMPVLANAAQRVRQDSLCKQISGDYICHYLVTLPESQLWTRENILFVNRYLVSVNINDKIFQLYYKGRSTIDSVMHDAYDGRFSDVLINKILYRDEVQPQVDKALRTSTEPRWHSLEKTILKNYDVHYVNENVLEGRVEYYTAKKNWKGYIKYFFRQQEMNGIDSWPGLSRSLDLNNDAYEVFKYDDNKRDLEKALSWISHALAATNTPDPQAMDTKANLLYKLGKKSEGLTLEKKSHALSPRDKEIAANYEKMKSGIPTWMTE